VLGAPAVARLLAAYVPGRTIQDRPVAVGPIARIQDIGDAQLVLIGAEHSSMLAELIGSLVTVLTRRPRAETWSRGAQPTRRAWPLGHALIVDRIS
jgi:hypothetical protein